MEGELGYFLSPRALRSEEESSEFFQVPDPIQRGKTLNFSKSQDLYIGRKLYTKTRVLRSSKSWSLYREGKLGDEVKALTHKLCTSISQAWDINIPVPVDDLCFAFLGPRAYMEGELGYFLSPRASRLEGESSNFSKSRSLYRGEKLRILVPEPIPGIKLGIFSSLRALHIFFDISHIFLHIFFISFIFLIPEPLQAVKLGFSQSKSPPHISSYFFILPSYIFYIFHVSYPLQAKRRDKKGHFMTPE